jgi:hypothetical protein
MKKYYCPITNEQFNQLINFGQILTPQCLVIEDNADFELVQSNLVEKFIDYIQFKYDEEYLVLEVFVVFNTEEKTVLLNIYNVESVYPISDECYKAVTFKHPKIEFSKPIFSVESLSKINDAFFLSDSKNGMDCLMSIFKNIFESTITKKDEIIRAASKFRKRYKLNSLQSDSGIIDFVFLYVYQAYYPLTTLGYFYRTAEILTRKALMNKSLSYNNEILEKTEIYKLLEEIKIDKPESNLQEIITILENDTRAKKFIDNLSDLDVKYFIVIPMFLKVVDEFNDNNQNIEKTSLEKLVKHYSSLYLTECQQLVLWVGAYLGYGNCYDYFYLKSNLKFFKSYKPITIVQEKNIVSEKESEIIVEELEIKPIEIISEIQPEIIEGKDTLDNDPLVEVTKVDANSVSTVLNENQQIILAALKSKGTCSLAELVKELKAKKGKSKISTVDVRLILKDMEGVNTFKDKKTEFASIEISKAKIESAQLDMPL